MTPKDLEIMSAMLDGEATERETQRILSQLHDPEMREAWQRLCQQKDGLHADSAEWSGVDISQSVMGALEAEAHATAGAPAESAAAGQALSGITAAAGSTDVSRALPWWQSLAVAASVAMVVVAGFQLSSGPQSGLNLPPQVVESPSGDSQALNGPVVAESLEAPQLSPEQKAEYEAYIQELLLRHAVPGTVSGASDIAPLARLSSYTVPAVSGETGTDEVSTAGASAENAGEAAP